MALTRWKVVYEAIEEIDCQGNPLHVPVVRLDVVITWIICEHDHCLCTFHDRRVVGVSRIQLAGELNDRHPVVLRSALTENVVASAAIGVVAVWKVSVFRGDLIEQIKLVVEQTRIDVTDYGITMDRAIHWHEIDRQPSLGGRSEPDIQGVADDRPAH